MPVFYHRRTSNLSSIWLRWLTFLCEYCGFPRIQSWIKISCLKRCTAQTKQNIREIYFQHVNDEFWKECISRLFTRCDWLMPAGCFTSTGHNFANGKFSIRRYFIQGCDCDLCWLEFPCDLISSATVVCKHVEMQWQWHEHVHAPKASRIISWTRSQISFYDLIKNRHVVPLPAAYH